MLSRFKSLITEIKSDINDKLDHFEADTKKVRNKSTRKIEQNLSLSGIGYLIKKDVLFEELEQNAKKNEKKVEVSIELIKEGLHESLRLKTNAENFKKEYNDLHHNIKIVKKALERVEHLCVDLNNELDLLEDKYDERMQKIKLNEMQTEFDNYCAAKIKEYEIREREKEKKLSQIKKVPTSDDPLEDLLANDDDDGITLGKLSLNPGNA